MIHMPRASPLSTISHNVRSSPAISIEASLRGARVVGSSVFKREDDDGVAERSWVWLIEKAALRERKVKER